jgi:hypothetical protein
MDHVLHILIGGIMKKRITHADVSMLVTAWSDTLSIDPRSGESIVTAQDLFRLECDLSTLLEQNRRNRLPVFSIFLDHMFPTARH